MYLRKIIWTFILLGNITLFAANKYNVSNKSFLKGETLNYRARWGFLTIGHAQTIIDPKVYLVQSHPCYKIDVKGQTNGIASLFYVKDSWSSYVDTSDLITHRTTRSIREGNYALDEFANYDQKNGKVAVSILNQKQKTYQEPKLYDTKENVLDLLGGFMMIRLIDFSTKKINDTINVTGFFEDTTYSLNIVYLGKEVIDTERGKVSCLILRPEMPANNKLKGKHSVVVWMADDDNKTVMRIRAKMFVGTFTIEIVS